MLKHGKSGQILRNQYNEALVLAAGYKCLDDFLERRIIRLIPIFPRPTLEGDVFDGFFEGRLRRDYIQQGYTDGLAALERESLVSIESEGIPEEAVIFAPELSLDPALDP